MTIQADKANVPLDISTLLDLLNASEEAEYADDVSVEATEQTPPRDLQTIVSAPTDAQAHNLSWPDAAEAQIAGGEDSETRSIADAANDRSTLEDIENRYAAHVIHGMAKSKREY